MPRSPRTSVSGAHAVEQQPPGDPPEEWPLPPPAVPVIPFDLAVLHRWAALARLAGSDLDAARLAEADLDARTILTELSGPVPGTGERWGVWAAEPPDGRVCAEPATDGWRLSGTKRWCSGLGWCTHALITARHGEQRRLFALVLDQAGVRPRLGEWAGLGMAGSATGSVELAGAVASAVGGPGAYLDRPGFWHGAIAVAACWYGGAVGVARPLRAAVAAGRDDPHTLAHLGAVDAGLAAARALLRAAADLETSILAARRQALRVRAVVEHAAGTAVDRVGRALGPGPLAHDREHAQRVVDLSVYLRQSHAERDLAALGALATGEDGDLG